MSIAGASAHVFCVFVLLVLKEWLQWRGVFVAFMWVGHALYPGKRLLIEFVYDRISTVDLITPMSMVGVSSTMAVGVCLSCTRSLNSRFFLGRYFYSLTKVATYIDKIIFKVELKTNACIKVSLLRSSRLCNNFCSLLTPSESTLATMRPVRSSQS